MFSGIELGHLDKAVTTARRALSQQVDKLVLQSINRRIPNSLEENFVPGSSLEKVLDETRVDTTKTAVSALTEPGEHLVWLTTPQGEVQCRITTRQGASKEAPVLLYHHGFAEWPYTSTWKRLLPKDGSLHAHSAAIQAPFHGSITDPLNKGFASVTNVYQMFAGSMRIMELLQNQFEAEGAAYTAVGGLSWGGITSLLYEGLLGRARAVVPMFASPNLAQVMWDAAELCGRPLAVPRETLDDLLDFTYIFERIDPQRVFAVMGDNDVFFRLEKHAPIFPEESLVTVSSTHVGAMWRQNDFLRDNVRGALAWAADHPL
jgi:hypothetical protein